MAFLALASQKSLLNLQKNFLQFRYISIMNQIQINQNMMDARKRELGNDADSTEDDMIIYFEEQDEILGSEKDSIDSQITAIENEISSLKTLVNNNIKASCSMNLLSS